MLLLLILSVTGLFTFSSCVNLHQLIAKRSAVFKDIAVTSKTVVLLYIIDDLTPSKSNAGFSIITCVSLDDVTKKILRWPDLSQTAGI